MLTSSQADSNMKGDKDSQAGSLSCSNEHFFTDGCHNM